MDGTTQLIPARGKAFPLRLFFQLFIPAFLLILGGAWYLGHSRIENELALIRANEINNIVLGVRRLDGELRRPLRQLRNLASAGTTRHAVDADAADAGIEATITALVAGDEHFDKVRWIDAQGMERVRAGRVGERVELVGRGDLQNIADTYFFQATMRLKPGQIYVSPLDLNIEHGKVETPAKPVLRLGTPVQDSTGRPRGILIINVAAQQMLNEFVESAGDSRDHVMLVNNAGFWLKSPNPDDEWGFMFKRTETLGTRSPEAWKAISSLPSSQAELTDGLWTWSTAYPLKVEDSRDVTDIPYWYVISHLSASQMNPIRAEAWKMIAPPALILLLAFGALAAWLTHALAARNQAEVAAVRAKTEAASARLLAEAHDRFRVVVETNTNGLLVADTDGRIVMANPALGKMFGYEREELVGQPLEILLPEAEHQRHRGMRDGYLRQPVARPMGIGRDLRGQRKDGSVFPVEISLSPFTENGKQFVDALVVDITERKRHETQQGDNT